MQHLMTLAEGGFFSFEWWQWVAILVLIGLIVLFFVMKKRG